MSSGSVSSRVSFSGQVERVRSSGSEPDGDSVKLVLLEEVLVRPSGKE